jgi:hypothetical protein
MRRAEPGLTEEELRQSLAFFSARFGSVVSNAGSSIRDETTDPLMRRRVLLWEIQLVPLVQESAFLPDPQEAFVAVNGVVVMQRRYFTEGDGAMTARRSSDPTSPSPSTRRGSSRRSSTRSGCCS